MINAIHKLGSKNSQESSKEEEMYGAKLKLQVVINKASKCLKYMYAEQIIPDKQEEVKQFRKVFKFRSPKIFRSLLQTQIDTSQEKNRRPEVLLDEKDLQKFQDYIAEQLRVSQAVNVNDYIWLRNLIVCRLTLYNARQ